MPKRMTAMGATGLLVSLLSLCAAWLVPDARAAADVVQPIGKGTVDWTTGVITVTGGGAPPEKGSAAQKRLMTKRAAQVDGYRQLAEVIDGVHVDSETVVKDFVTQSDTIRTSVSALVKGALVHDTRYLSDGSAEVDLVAKMFGSQGLFDAVDPWQNRKPGPPPTVQVLAPRLTSWLLASAGSLTSLPRLQLADAPYTGVILNAKGLGGEPAMSPAILDSGGGELYVGSVPVNPDYAVNVGLAGFYTTLEEAKADNSRAGSNPLILRPKAMAGNFRCNAKLTLEDSQALLRADQQGQFLKDAKVVFVV